MGVPEKLLYLKEKYGILWQMNNNLFEIASFLSDKQNCFEYLSGNEKKLFFWFLYRLSDCVLFRFSLFYLLSLFSISNERFNSMFDSRYSVFIVEACNAVAVNEAIVALPSKGVFRGDFLIIPSIH
jgi:hypothetical protein